ncbi:MAG: co-chaperone GroES [Bacillota bacterium]
MKIRPLNEKVAVKFIKEEKEEKTESGIVIPDTAKDDKKPQQGEVIAVGNKIGEGGDAPVKVGDRVVFDKYAGSNVNLDDEEFVILDLEDVLAVVEK